MTKYNFTCWYGVSLTLNEEFRLRWLENMALGKIFFFKRGGTERKLEKFT